jgi:crotonobetainyl-CoA:carnitine CoA-transferase CaiB-like acyl-CoA transferase
MSDQLKNLKVLELASVLAGPGVGQFFAELGAEVIKVENVTTGGDVTRSWKVAGETTDDRSAYFCCVNWGKQSIAIDLTKYEGQKIVQELAAQSDVVIASYKPGDAEKLNVDYKTLAARNPKLIYGQITGYGAQNPKVGYDAIIQAESGYMFMNGEPGGKSLKMPVALMDVLAGHHLKEGLLLAMLEKMSAGKGKLVEVSLIESAVASLANQATNWLVAGKLPKKAGSAHPNIAPYGDVFLTSDSKELLLAVGNDRQFKDLCAILELTDVIDDQRFARNADRVENRSKLNELLASAIHKHSSEALVDKLNRSKIPGGLIQNISQVFQMDEVQNMVFASGDLKGVRTLAANSHLFSSHFTPPPHLGQHTRSILIECLHYSPETVEKLMSLNVIQ